MKLFLSYPSEHRDIAEEIFLALSASRHEVFFDKESLQAGGDFRRRLRRAIDQSEMFIFLISPESVAPKSFARTELMLASKKWKHPKNHVLPVMLTPTPLDSVPAYLRAVTILEPEGDIAAEISAWVDRWSPLEEIDTGELAKEQIEEAPENLQGILTFFHELGAFSKEVATTGQPNKTYRKSIRWTVDRAGTVFDEPTALTGTRSQNFSDEQGRTCCDVTITWRWHGEKQWLEDTSTLILERGQWKVLPRTDQGGGIAEPTGGSGDPDVDELMELLKQEKST